MLSIILPTYNSIEFLEDRVDSIINQTLNDWECIVIDGESSDGSWEYLTRIAQIDSRFKLFQLPPKGVYNAWNEGVIRSSGDYIYFATSDDTMTNDCLMKMEKALEENIDCGLVHSGLLIIDETGKASQNMDWEKFPPQKYLGELSEKYHKRLAPLSGIMYFTHQTVIHSFTQVLLRKRLFDEYGLFKEDIGVEADLEWGMRVCLVENIVHLPEKLATWRIHGKQATKLGTERIKINHLMELRKTAVLESKIDMKLKHSILNSLNELELISWELLFSDWTKMKKLLTFNYWKFRTTSIKVRKSINHINRDKLFNYCFNHLLSKSPEAYIIESKSFSSIVKK